MNDTLTLSLFGNIPLRLFTIAIRQFDLLVKELTAEAAGSEAAIQWDVSHLRSGSATIQVRGLSDDFDAVERAVRGYDAIGEALERHEPIPFSAAVQRPVYALAGLLNGHITALALTSDDKTHNVTSPVTEDEVEQPARWATSWGVLRGEVGAIAKRPSLQFTLYDSVFDRAVACYLTKENEQIAREIWGKQVAVTGFIYRRVDDGRPIRIRNIASVEQVSQASGDIRQARGALPWRHGDEFPEEIIRRWRRVS